MLKIQIAIWSLLLALSSSGAEKEAGMLRPAKPDQLPKLQAILLADYLTNPEDKWNGMTQWTLGENDCLIRQEDKERAEKNTDFTPQIALKLLTRLQSKPPSETSSELIKTVEPGKLKEGSVTELKKPSLPKLDQPIFIDAAQLGLLEKSLETSDLALFHHTTKELLPSGCATIHSQWYCECLLSSRNPKDLERAQHEIRLRTLGDHLLRLLELECGKFTSPGVGLADCKLEVYQLMSLSDWLLKGGGYGNGILASRCRVIAGLAAAHVVIEESISLEEAQAIIDELGSFGEMEWIHWAIQAHEYEAQDGIAPFVEKAETPEGARKALLKASIRGQSLLAENGIQIGVGKVGIDLSATRKARLSLPPKLAIYLNDPIFGSSTLEQWDRYCLLPDPLHTRLFSDLRATMFFRKCVGSFPLTPLPDDTIIDGKLNDRYLSRTHAAFEKAWHEFSNKKEFLNSDLKTDPLTGQKFVDTNGENLPTKYANMELGGNAAMIYDAVKSSHFENYLNGDTPKK